MTMFMIGCILCAPNDYLFESIEAQDGFYYVPIWDLFCQEDCALIQDGIPLYTDDDHVTYRAAREIICPQLRERVPASLLKKR